MNVVFSNRAYVALLSETQEKIKTETGGVFLGYYENETWYIVETIDPGPASIFEVAYFEYDQKYVNHLINKIARLYRKNLSLLGLWHRHPGSFDIFSSTDDGTNRTYARMTPQGAISALVNIDPIFRLTVYHVPQNLNYKKISYQVGDQYFPEGTLALLTEESLLDRINKKGYGEDRRSLQVQLSPPIAFSELMDSICASLKEFNGVKYKEEIFSALDDEAILEKLSGEILEDADYLFEQAKIPVKVRKTARYLCMFDDSERTTTQVFFSFIKSVDKYVFIYKNKCYLYSSGTFSRLIEDGISERRPKSFWQNVKNFFKITRS